MSASQPVPRRTHPIHRWLPLGALALLAACATTPPEATVQVYTAQPVLAGATYRYERLPSQAAQPNLAQLEAVADALLARGGLRRDDGSPRLSVQLSATQDRPAGLGYGSPSVGVGLGAGNWGSGIGIGLGFPIGGGGVPAPTQRVDVVVRELAGGRVVWQSQASGGSGASPVALVDAALRDFPNAPPGTRQVPLAGAAAR